jgi:putative protease
MEESKRIPELLAPANSLFTIEIAFIYGADAVYVGYKDLNLRYRAKTLSFDELKQAILLAKKLGKKIYITINSLIHERNIGKLRQILEEIKELVPNGIIIHDPSVLVLADKLGIKDRGIEIHLSTQNSVVNHITACFWHSLGIDRIILARELFRNEVKKIVEGCKDIGFEVFIHGAVCIAYSGRCLLSLYFTGRDANRGDCAQPCRWEYILVDKKYADKNVEIIEDKSYTTLLSGYDLCRLPMLDRWVETGVSAFKIEGRMKNSYYIANVVRVYRYALDKIAKGEFSKYDIEYGLRELDKMAHREFSLNLQSKPFMKARENKDIYIGDVLYNIGEDDSYVVARGRIEVGKEYEVLLPGNEIKNSRVIVRKIYRNGKEVSRAGGGEVYRIIFDGKVYPKTILRRVI